MKKIKTIPKEKMKGIKEMSPYMIDELMLLGIHLSNIKEREENDEKAKTIHQEREGQVRGIQARTKNR